MKKRLLLLFCMIACLFSLVACESNGDKKSSKKALQYDEESLKSQLEQVITDLSNISKKDALNNLELVEKGTMDYVIYETWSQNVDELGKFKSIDDYKFSSTDKVVTCVVKTTYSKRKATMTFFISNEEPGFKIEPKYSLGEKMEKAVLNTLLGMGTVFVVLILIAWLISLFKYINKIEKKLKDKKENEITAVQAVENTIAQIAQKEEIDMTDDTELVAVITAAIAAASESAAPGDFVVRSIKRVNKRNWNRA